MTSATADGTQRFRACCSTPLDPSYFNEADGLWLSSIGLGTYLGEADDTTSTRYEQAIHRALALGCNVIDTAINYRFQLSEQAIGRAMQGVARDEVFVATKGGYVPFDRTLAQIDEMQFAEAAGAYIERTFIQTGIAEPEDFAQGGMHCMTRRYLAHQVNQSRANLGLECIDLYYIHNPEGQLGEVAREQFNARLRAAFEYLEQAVSAGHIRRYGAATWNGFRQIPSARDYLSLADILDCARAVAGDAHHFKAIQLPINLAMTEALEHKNQQVNGRWLSVLDAARELGLMVFASASLLQARLSRHLPGALRKSLGADLSDAQRALQFTRSLPGVTCALVGMSDVEHVEENLRLARLPRLMGAELQKAFA